MSDESAVIEQDAVQDKPAEEVSTQAEETAPKPDAEPAASGETPSPLEPGGERFKQVWARAKSAEAKAAELAAEVQREREERIRYEERLKAQEEAKAKSEPKYTWAQLEQFIEAGQIDRGRAMDIYAAQLKKEAKEEALREIESKIQTTAKASTVLSEIERYKRAMPEIAQPGTEERQRVEREYAYMVQVLGFPPTHATELAATRAALGDVETVERKVQARKTATKESFMETHSSTHKPQPKGKDPIEQLDERQRAHYQKMISTGRYSGWDEVRKELEWQPPSLRVVRG